jgi:Fe-S-cluster containining protein
MLRKDHLVTTRKGEWAYDNVQDALMILKSEMIRIRPGQERKGCLFLDTATASCGIYDHRPVECRAMKCWDLREIIELYPRDRLTRWDLIPEDSALGQIMAEHERLCDYAQVARICEGLLEREDQELAAELAGMVQTDQGFRASLKERAGADEPALNFVFGKPLTSTLPLFGLRVVTGEQGGVVFRPETISRSRLLRVEKMRSAFM